MRFWVGPGQYDASELPYFQHDRNLNAAVLGSIVFTLFQVCIGRILWFYLVLAVLCAIWAALEAARRPALRRRARIRGALGVAAILSRPRADEANSFLIGGPLIAICLPVMGSAWGGMRGAVAGGAGALIYLLCMGFAERYPVDPRSRAA
jgi:hypothetical protein